MHRPRRRARRLPRARRRRRTRAARDPRRRGPRAAPQDRGTATGAADARAAWPRSTGAGGAGCRTRSPDRRPDGRRAGGGLGPGSRSCWSRSPPPAAGCAPSSARPGSCRAGGAARPGRRPAAGRAAAPEPLSRWRGRRAGRRRRRCAPGPAGARVERSKATAALTFFAWSVRPRCSSSSPTDSTVAVGSATPWPAMSGAEPCTGSNMLGLVPDDVEVAAGGQPDAAGHRGGDVGDDVAEEVVGDDDVVAARVGDEEHRGGVDVLVGDRDLGELGRHLLDRPRPQPAGVGEHVGLVDQGEVLARAGDGPLEGVAHHPLDAEGGVER